MPALCHVWQPRDGTAIDGHDYCMAEDICTSPTVGVCGGNCGRGGGAAWTTSNQPYTTKQAMVMGQRCRCVIHWHAVGDKIYGYTDR